MIIIDVIVYILSGKYMKLLSQDKSMNSINSILSEKYDIQHKN